MSRKTMDETIRRDHGARERIFNIYPPPDTMYQQNDDERAQDLIDHRLNDNSCTPAYKVPWKMARLLSPQAGHLDIYQDDCRDAVWGVTEGKRDVRQLKRWPEYNRRK